MATPNTNSPAEPRAKDSIFTPEELDHLIDRLPAHLHASLFKLFAEPSTETGNPKHAEKSDNKSQLRDALATKMTEFEDVVTQRVEEATKTAQAALRASLRSQVDAFHQELAPWRLEMELCNAMLEIITEQSNATLQLLQRQLEEKDDLVEEQADEIASAKKASVNESEIAAPPNQTHE